VILGVLVIEDLSMAVYLPLLTAMLAGVGLAGEGRANTLTNPALDPVSRMPEFKVCAVRVEAAAG
ncbi:hypothetical protein AB0P40_38570, partial [Streptomyces sp. NPDC079189]|uniref:hypothetical protein n=1 Tax=Streptomyces sp. NPDC079189 TaxID=3154514 RepID=UPI003436AFB6